MILMKSFAYFLLAGVCEIGGGYLIWLWLRENKSIWYAAAGAILLVLYGVIPTLQLANFGRVMLLTAACSSCFRFCGAGELIRSRPTDSTLSAAWPRSPGY